MPDITRLLARHFFRRFIENDLISPDADRHQTLAVITACLVSFGIVVTMLISLKYVGGLPTPGQVSLLTLDDKFLYCGWSMGVMALVTLVEWNALALDARDASILGPLPIQDRVIFRAKAAALGMFAGGCLVVLNAVPAVIFSSAMVSTPLVLVGLPSFFRLLAVQLLITTAAGALGFLAVLAARELLHAVLGAPLFERISTFLQAALVVCMVLFLCLLPGMSNRVGRTGLAPDRVSHFVPPLWFVGMSEVGAGGIVDGLSRAGLPRRLVSRDRQATQLYRSRGGEFERLAGIGVAMLLLTSVTASAAYVWNNRRLPPVVTARRDVPHRIRVRFVDVIQRYVVRRPLARAGFFFTLQTLWRSGTHRLTMTAAAAVGLAIATLGARSGDVILIQPIVLAVLVIAFRHAARVPGELRANWAFQSCWSGERAPYFAGVKLAGLLCVLAPALLAMLPLGVVALGIGKALLQLLLGGLLAKAALDVGLLGFRTLPFAASYAGGGNLKGWLPGAALAFFPLSFILAGAERAALDHPSRCIVLSLFLLAAIAGIRAFDRRQRESYGPVDFYELPGQTQRLDLSA